MAADGDPEDAVVLGARIEEGSVIRMPVWGQIRFIDAGVPDHKWVCGITQPTDTQWRALEWFFRSYVWAKRALYRMRGTPGAVQYLGLERFSVEGSQSS